MCPAPPLVLNVQALCGCKVAFFYHIEIVYSLKMVLSVSGVQDFEEDPAPKESAPLFTGSVYGHFTSTIRQDVFSVYAHAGGCMNVLLKTVLGATVGGGNVEEFAYEWCATNATGFSMPLNMSAPIRLVAGDFDEDNYDEVVITFLDGNNNLQV